MVDVIRTEQWQTVLREMPVGMTQSVNTMSVNEKVIFSYTCFNGVPIREWVHICKTVIEFGQVLSKLWHEEIARRQLQWKGWEKEG